jgi:hypothetical protein
VCQPTQLGMLLAEAGEDVVEVTGAQRTRRGASRSWKPAAATHPPPPQPQERPALQGSSLKELAGVNGCLVAFFGFGGRLVGSVGQGPVLRFDSKG